jgi:hypothetical protein
MRTNVVLPLTIMPGPERGSDGDGAGGGGPESPSTVNSRKGRFAGAAVLPQNDIVSLPYGCRKAPARSTVRQRQQDVCDGSYSERRSTQATHTHARTHAHTHAHTHTLSLSLSLALSLSLSLSLAHTHTLSLTHRCDS